MPKRFATTQDPVDLPLDVVIAATYAAEQLALSTQLNRIDLKLGAALFRETAQFVKDNIDLLYPYIDSPAIRCIAKDIHRH